MTKRQREEFDKALEAFDEGLERLDKSLDVVLAIALHEREEEHDEEV